MHMTDTTVPVFHAVTPRLPVANVEELLAFYVGSLGFRLGWTWGEPATHANVCRNEVSLDLISVPKGREGTAMAYVEMSGVDAYHAELAGRNVAITAVQNRAYGMRDFEVVDPCGNRIAFGQPLEP